MKRHSWGDPVRPDANNTFRTCANCGLVRITRHEADANPPHWVQFRHGEKQIVFKNDPSKTPPCGSFESIAESLLGANA